MSPVVSTSELERRLGEVLRQHAEDAMNSTDTQTRFETLERAVERTRPRTRIGLVAAAATAAAVVAALVVVDASRDDGSVTPAGPVDTRAATELASDFVDAVATYDGDRAASYLAAGARIELRTSIVDAESIGPQLRWTQAAGWRMLPGRCEEATVSAPAPAVTIACAFAVHGLGSERLGRGPFPHYVFRLTVVDGEIVSGRELGSDGFGTTMWEPFTAWLLSNHMDDAEFMYADWPGNTQPALTERSARLWEKNVDRYVGAVTAGEAS
jgi:hypothetical protein